MIWLKSKQKKVESQLAEYRRSVAFCLEGFHNAFEQYSRNGDRDALRSSFKTVHKAESLADDIRREIEVMMYSKAVFPESRGDILGLLEAVDKVPNNAEYAVQMMLSRRIVIPESLREGVLQLVGICHRCGDALLEAMGKLFEDFTQATVALGKIDELESEADHREESLVEQAFDGDLQWIEKLLLSELFKCIASVSDRAENAGDRIRIIVAKRRI